MARNSGNRAMLILLAGLILVVFLITTVSQADLGGLLNTITSTVNSAAENVSDTITPSDAPGASGQLAQNIADYLKNPEVLELPAGDRGIFLERDGFFLAYSARYHIALWVGYELTDKEAAGELPRDDAFRRDPDLGDLSPSADSYAGSGYDRGHLVPAGDLKWSRKAMDQSFFMSNIAPQVPSLNRGVWRELEEAVRELAGKEGAVIVITGPVISPRDYPVLEKAGTIIPEYYFKVILDFREPRVGAWGFIIPNNADVLSGKDYADFLFSVDAVEEYTGFDFFAALPDNLEDRLERRPSAIF